MKTSLLFLIRSLYNKVLELNALIGENGYSEEYVISLINDYINHLTLCINDKCEIIKGNVISYTNEVITLEVQD